METEGAGCEYRQLFREVYQEREWDNEVVTGRFSVFVCLSTFYFQVELRPIFEDIVIMKGGNEEIGEELTVP